MKLTVANFKHRQHELDNAQAHLQHMLQHRTLGACASTNKHQLETQCA